MSTHRIVVFALSALLSLAVLPAAQADARPKGLKMGMNGPAVERLQKNLTRAGFRTGADGAFGPATRGALMRWERSRHRRVDGIATRRDRRALRRSARFGTRVLRVGMRGRDVRGLQYHLTRTGFSTGGRDGVFGPMTRASLVRWEGSRGLRADGVATRRDQRGLLRRRASSRRPAPRPRVRAWISRRGFAHAPGAPARVQRLIRAGNRIARKPYRYGGGHGTWNDSAYDCSGSVSYVLHHAGLLRGPARASGGFMNWGLPGRGRWVTVYAHGGHMFLMVAGLRFDTSDRERDGTRWHRDVRTTAGYAVRHPGGIR